MTSHAPAPTRRTRPPASYARLGAVLVGLVCLCHFACGGGESGIAPPSDRIFLPTGLVVDPAGRWLYVVNSNSDLRFNGGTLAAVDLEKVAEDRAQRARFPRCGGPSFQPPTSQTGRFCCRDFDNPNTLNCLDRPYLAREAAVRIGSFGGVVTLQCGRGGTDCRPETLRRIFIGVRSDPSITYVDARVSGDALTLRCTSGSASEKNPVCSIDYRLQEFTDAEDRTLPLPEEPFTLALDEQRGVLYVGHLFGGVTAIDACEPERRKPAIAAELTRLFADPRQGVTTLSLGPEDGAGPTLFATGRLQVPSYVTAAAQIQVVRVRGAGDRCGPENAGIARRPLGLSPGVAFVSPALYPGGKDMRGALLGPDGRHLFILHRNGDSRLHPAALAVIERLPPAVTEGNATGGQGAAPSAATTPNRAVDVIEVCAGATEMQFHDAGRGPHLFITCFEAGQVYVIDPARVTVAAVINLGRGPARLAVSPRDPTLAFVSEFIDNDVAVVDLRPGSPTEYQVVQRIGFPHASKK